MTYLPELLRGILARNALEDLGSAGVLVDELGHVVDVAVDDDVEALVGRVVGGDVGGGEGLGHFVVISERSGVGWCGGRWSRREEEGTEVK